MTLERMGTSPESSQKMLPVSQRGRTGEGLWILAPGMGSEMTFLGKPLAAPSLVSPPNFRNSFMLSLDGIVRGHRKRLMLWGLCSSPRMAGASSQGSAHPLQKDQLSGSLRAGAEVSYTGV